MTEPRGYRSVAEVLLQDPLTARTYREVERAASLSPTYVRRILGAWLEAGLLEDGVRVRPGHGRSPRTFRVTPLGLRALRSKVNKGRRSSPVDATRAIRGVGKASCQASPPNRDRHLSIVRSPEQEGGAAS